MPTYATPQPITAVLTTAGARVRLAASDRSDTVVLVEPVDSASKTDVKVAGNTRVDFAAGRLSVKTNTAGGKNGSVAITIELPAGSGLVLNTSWTDVHADGPLGDCKLDIASGNIELDRVTRLEANLAAGDVAIGHITGAADVEGASAGLRIGTVEGALSYRGATGEVRIGEARSDVDLSSSSGSFDIGRAEGSVVAEAANCPIRIGRMTRGRAKLANAAGGIEVGISEGTAAWVDAKSTKGAVHSSLSPKDQPDASAEKVEIYARTRRDDIVIHRATN